MLGRTAGGLYWMFRYLERSENTARLVETGLRISLTKSSDKVDDWSSILDTAAAKELYLEHHASVDDDKVIDFLLRDRSNPSSVLSVIEAARMNARQVRTALTREVWEATNDCWMRLHDVLRHPVSRQRLPDVLAAIRQESALVRGALHGTMLRNDIYNFCRLGTFIERADNTARILDVKYYVLLPSPLLIGTQVDNVQWETLLRALSAQRAYHWQHRGPADAQSIAEFLVLDPRMPRSLAFCYRKIAANLGYLGYDYGDKPRSHEIAIRLHHSVAARSISEIFGEGLHEFLLARVADTRELGEQIEADYRFTR